MGIIRARPGDGSNSRADHRNAWKHWHNRNHCDSSGRGWNRRKSVGYTDQSFSHVGDAICYRRDTVTARHNNSKPIHYYDSEFDDHYDSRSVDHNHAKHDHYNDFEPVDNNSVRVKGNHHWQLRNNWDRLYFDRRSDHRINYQWFDHDHFIAWSGDINSGLYRHYRHEWDLSDCHRPMFSPSKCRKGNTEHAASQQHASKQHARQ